MVYIIPLILMILGIIRFDYARISRGKLFLYILIGFLLICVAGFRYRIGFDTQQYSGLYDKLYPIQDIRLKDYTSLRYEPGFLTLMSITKALSPEFVVFQLIVSLIINTVFFYFIWNNSRNVFWGILLYYVFLYINLNAEVLREALAVSVFLLSWPFFRDGKWLIYYLFALLAVTFHSSAIIMWLLPLTCAPGIKYLFGFGKRTVVLGVIILAFGLILGHYLFDYLKLFSLTDNISERVQAYSKNNLGGLKTLNFGGLIFMFLKSILLPILAIYFLNKTRENLKNRNIERMERMAIMSIYVSLFSAGVYIFARFNNYLFIFPLILVSDWIFTNLKIAGQNIRFGMVTWVAAILIYLGGITFLTYNQPVNRDGTIRAYMSYYPYDNYFSQEKDSNREKLFRYIHRKGF